jgi:ribosomal protein S18 acetylase RimI-like enzyme
MNSMNEYLIRPLARSDLGRINEIDRAAFSAEEQYDDAVYEFMLQSGQSVAAVDGANVIVGYAFVQILDEWPWAVLLDGARRPRCRSHSHLRSVAVHPRYQRRGYGKAMLLSVLQSARGFVDLLVDEWNAPAIGLYKSLGFMPAEMCSTVPPKRRMVLEPRT